MIKSQQIGRYVCKSLLCSSAFIQTARFFSLQDASTALRPFYFIVHPDLFGQHPAERAVNENSLKLLNQYLNSYKAVGSKPRILKTVVFYMRSQEDSGLRPVKISLDKSNLRDTVLSILSACNLTTSHVPMPKTPIYGTNRPITWSPSFYDATGQKNPNDIKAKPQLLLNLRSWLRLNGPRSQKYENAVKHTKAVANQLESQLKNDLSLKDIRFDSVWSFQHYRACLKSFHRLYKEHPEFLELVLKDKVLLFSNNTGVSRLGEIILSHADVPERWLTLLKSVGAYEAVLGRLPVMESKLSSLLNNIEIIQVERRNSSVMAEEYELLLNTLLNSLRRCQRLVNSTFLGLDLSHLKLAVEGPMSPLTLSSQGYFLIPASIPGALAVDFIDKNKHIAKQILAESDRLRSEEEQSRQRVLKDLEMAELTKDESVSSSQMVSCCQRLLEEHDYLPLVTFRQSRVRVSHYFSVMQDGCIIIPWDWKEDQ